MDRALLDILRCPFCGTRLELVDNGALSMHGDLVAAGVLGCECCAYPVVDGIPVLLADDSTRRALHALEAGRGEDALLDLLGAEEPGRRERLRAMVRGGRATYREALELLCDNAEATYMLHRFSDPTYVAVETLLRAIAAERWPLSGRALDLCGGSGHLTRILAGERPSGPAPAPATVLADLHFWKLWLARRFVVPEAEAVCCDANSPLPFARASFSAVLLADAFPYLWHKRLVVGEMERLVAQQGVVVMPHLHSALGDNHSAGDTLTPASYQALFETMPARLFSDARILDDALDRCSVDLARHVPPDELADEPTFTLIASNREDLFRRHELQPRRALWGELAVNPLYGIETNGAASTLTLTFPTPEYEDEFGACRRYLPDRLLLEADLAPPLEPSRFGPEYGELRDRRILLDVPAGYAS